MIRIFSPLLLIVAVIFHPAIAVELPIPIAIIERATPVDFDSEVMPLLQRSCLACHHAKKPEGGLVLESLASLITGGESGTGVAPKDSASSLLLSRASGATEPLMPPEDNTVGAKPLSSQELGLIKLWIDQGASASLPKKVAALQWQPIAPSLQPIYAVATSGDSRFAASGRGNRVTVYDLATGADLGLLSDPSLPTPATDLDIVQSIAFSPDGNQIATGGFRSVKLWRRVTAKVDLASLPLVHAAGLIVSNHDGSRMAWLNAIGDIELWNITENSRIGLISELESPIVALAFASGGERLLSINTEGRLLVSAATNGKEIARFETNSIATALATADDGRFAALIDGERHVRLFRIEATDAESPVVITPVEHPAIASVSDANAILFTRDPLPTLAIGTEAGNVSMIAAQTGELVRNLSPGSPVTALALTGDATRIAVGGRDGRTRLFQIGNGEPSITLESNASFQLSLLAVQRNMARQDAEVARQTARVTELETFATNEAAAQTKLQTERGQVAETLKAEELKLAEAATMVVATEASNAQSKVELDAAAQQVDVGKKSIADMTVRIDQISADLEKQKTLVNDLSVQENKDEAKVAEATAVVAATEATLVQAKMDLETATKQDEAAQKLVVDLTARLTASNAELEKQKAAQTAADQQKAKTTTLLTQKDQTLVNANQATERAKASIPVQTAFVSQRTRLAGEAKRQMNELQLRSTASVSPTTSVVAGDHWIATLHLDGRVRIYRLADGVLLDDFPSSSTTAPLASTSGLIRTAQQTVCALHRTGPPAIFSIAPRWELERTIGGAEESTISDRVTAIDYRPDGNSIAIGSGPPSRLGEIKIFSVVTGELLRDFANVHSDTVLGVRFSPDGQILASSAADRTAKLLDVATGKLIRTLEGHTNYVLALAWQDDGIGIATAGADQSVKVWDSSNGTQRRTIVGFPKEVTSITYAGTTSQLVTACADGQVRIYKADDGALVRAMNSADSCLHSISTTLDPKTILSGGQNGQLQVWLFENGQLLRDIK